MLILVVHSSHCRHTPGINLGGLLMETGFRAVAQRIVNAENGFVQILMEKGFTRDEAAKAMRTMLKLKVAKMDAVNGRISVKHGAYLESAAIRNAVNY
jgi:type IV pilus biogenesis protein CpaD/CtpE